MAKTSSSYRETAASWAALAKHLQAKSVLPEGSPKLTEYALDVYNPRIVIERLLATEPTYFAHKEILFAGLSAWTVAPHRPYLVKEAMILAGMSQLADLERSRQEEFPQDTLLADIVSRLSGPGIDFYRDFYYPAGGLRCAVDARSPELLRQSLLDASKDIGFQVEIMRICHYHLDNLQNRRIYRQSSIECSCIALEQLIKADSAPAISGYHSNSKPELKRTINVNNCRKKIAPYHTTAALIYAANSISLQNDTLLSGMCKGQVTLENHGEHLHSWLGRAVYTEKRIIGAMYGKQSTEKDGTFLPHVEESAIFSPDYGEKHVIIDRAYSRDSVNKIAIKIPSI